MRRMASFKNKVVLVTGASAGIGEATAKHFAKQGASLALTGRNEERVKKVAKECVKLGSEKAIPIVADFENLDNVKKVYDETIANFKSVDALVNNAGYFRGGVLCDVKLKDFDDLFKVNVKAILYLSQLVMPHLVESKGNIVNVSSVASSQVTLTRLVYGMAKAALDQFTRTVALEYASKGVRVNSVNPSNVRTKITSDKGLTPEEVDLHYAERAARHPMGRVGTVDEVAKYIVFLASDEASWITGQCMILDGGISLLSRR